MVCLVVSGRPLSADSGHGEHSGAEEAADGPGHLHEDSGLFLHRHLLRSTVQRGNMLLFITAKTTSQHQAQVVKY